MPNAPLSRFLEAQERTYEIALAELRCGRKRTHWMWFVFPQLQGLGMSATAQFYGIKDLTEARDYLAHPILSQRLLEATEALLSCPENNAGLILGATDAMKLRSSMTLFSLISTDGSVFHLTLQKFFQGKRDEKTLALLGMA